MVSGRIALPEGVTLSEELANFYGTQSRIMESVHVRQRAAERVESKSPELRVCSVYLSVAQEHGTSFFNLTAVGEEPNYTQAFLNACMEEYIRLKRQWWEEMISKKLISLTEEQLKEEKQLETGFDELLEFKKKYNVAALEEEGNSAGKRLAQLNERLASLKQEYELLKLLDVEQNIERKHQSANANATSDGSTDSTTAPSGAEEEYLRGKQQVHLLKAEKQRRGRVMRPKHPLMLKLDAEIAQQEGLIQLYFDQSFAQLANKRESIRFEIETLEVSVKDWGERTLELTGRLAAYEKIKAKVDQSKAVTNSLQNKGGIVAVDGRLQDDVVKVMDQASAAEPTKPGLIKDLSIGALCGLLLGLIVVLL